MTRILVVEGDGIGPEVVGSALRVLDELAPDVETVPGTAGRGALETYDDPLGPETREAVTEDAVDGVLFGATETRPGEPSAALALRSAADARVSVRPARARRPGTRACEVTIYRELTEDLYVQEETSENGSATATRRITREATDRFARLALAHAPSDPPPILAHKATILPETDGLFRDTVQAVADELDHPIEPQLVDAVAHDIALDPSGPTAVLAPNLYGDLLSDLTAGLAGGLGLAPSLILGGGPPIAEPVHGTAPDIAGKGVANPVGALGSLALLLDELGRERPARRLEIAVNDVLSRGRTLTPDLGGSATTEAFTDAVIDTLEVSA